MANLRVKMERCLQNLCTKSRKYYMDARQYNVLDSFDAPLRNFDDESDARGILVLAVDSAKSYIFGEGVLYEKFKRTLEVPACLASGKVPSTPGDPEYSVSDYKEITFDSSFTFRGQHPKNRE